MRTSLIANEPRTFRSGAYLDGLFRAAERMDANLQADICARIKQARIEAGFTQQEAADTLGITLRAYQNYEATRVPFRSLTRIADVFDVPERWLLHGGDQSEQPSTLSLLQELREAVDASAESTAEALEALAAGIARIEARLPVVAVRRRKAV